MMQSVEAFIEETDCSDLNHCISKFTNVMMNNIKIKMLERLNDPSVEYDIKAECDKFIELLQLKTGKTKKELAKLLKE